MQPVLHLSAADVSMWVAGCGGPAAHRRIHLAAPVASETDHPEPGQIDFGLSLAFLLAPMAPSPTSLSIFSGAGLLAAVQEMLIGVAIGMVVQLAFEALTFAGQTISLTMGLGLRTLVDPQHGQQRDRARPVVHDRRQCSRISRSTATWCCSAPGGELSDPAHRRGAYRQGFPAVGAAVGRAVFETGLLIALPAVIALVIVNLALGVVTRAAPQLNLFGIGFTITLLCGFFVLIVGLDGIMAGISSLINSA
jgi:flagellar biosynthetic protein FliR